MVVSFLLFSLEIVQKDFNNFSLKEMFYLQTYELLVGLDMRKIVKDF